MPKKVMIVDNDESILDVMSEALQFGGFDVKVLRQADNIFPLLEEYKPDILLIDYLLDGVNGGEICHEIKSVEATRSLPVVIVSAYPKVLQSLGNYNCDAFIAKPFDLYELIDRVTELLKKKSYIPIN
ncbi:MAG: response regulator [Sphingobacteriaceae bacterium]|nr:MAG: response regulator [Sphingobacteriaceae bacterium]